MLGNVLSNLKVVELGEFISAPFCARMLSDWGADVIKVEKPGDGDRSRQHGPFPKDKPDKEKSGLYLYLNANKKSITLNVRDVKGRKILKQLLKDADVLVENKMPGEMMELGLDYDTLEKECPKLIICSITPYGQTGPYKDYKGYCLSAAAASGFSSFQGNPDREPLDHPMSYAEYVGGMSGAVAVLLSIFARFKSGKGQHCDIATFQILNGYHCSRTLYARKILGIKSLRTGSHGGTLFYPANILPCKDGDYCFYSIDFNHWQRLMEVLGNPEWSKDERFTPPQATSVFSLQPYIDELDALMSGELENWTKDELFAKCRDARTPFIPVFDMRDLVNSPQSEARNNFVEIEHPKAGKLKYPGAPAVMHGSPWKLSAAAPLLGQNNAEVYGKLGYSKQDMSDLEHGGVI